MPNDAPEQDRLTLAALAVLAYALANVGHEGLGHAGACLLVGGDPVLLSAIHFAGEYEGLGLNAVRAVAAGGTLVNFAFGVGSWLLLRGLPASAAHARVLAWLLLAVNLLQGTGYWLFSGLGNVGDWAKIARTVPQAGLVRVALAVAGGLGYWLAATLSVRELRPIVGGDEGRVERARRLMMTAYLSGGALYLAAGLLNPVGFLLVMISAAAASFGGTSAFTWMNNLLRDPAYASEAPALALPRRTPWLIAAGVAAAVFILVLGPGVKL